MKKLIVLIPLFLSSFAFSQSLYPLPSSSVKGNLYVRDSLDAGLFLTGGSENITIGALDSGQVTNTFYPFTYSTPFGDLPAYEKGLRVGRWEQGIKKGMLVGDLGLFLGQWVKALDDGVAMFNIDSAEDVFTQVIVDKNFIDLVVGTPFAPISGITVDTIMTFFTTDTTVQGDGGYKFEFFGVGGNDYAPLFMDGRSGTTEFVTSQFFQVRDTNNVIYIDVLVQDSVLVLGNRGGRSMLNLDGSADGGIFIGDSVPDFSMFRNRGFVQMQQGFSDNQEVAFRVIDVDSSYAELFNVSTEGNPSVTIGSENYTAEFSFINGTESEGAILTSDANGNASWSEPAIRTLYTQQFGSQTSGTTWETLGTYTIPADLLDSPSSIDLLFAMTTVGQTADSLLVLFGNDTALFVNGAATGGYVNTTTMFYQEAGAVEYINSAERIINPGSEDNTGSSIDIEIKAKSATTGNQTLKFMRVVYYE